MVHLVHLLAELVAARLVLALLVRLQFVIEGLELLGLLLYILEARLRIQTCLVEAAIQSLSILVCKVFLVYGNLGGKALVVVRLAWLHHQVRPVVLTLVLIVEVGHILLLVAAFTH